MTSCVSDAPRLTSTCPLLLKLVLMRLNSESLRSNKSRWSSSSAGCFSSDGILLSWRLTWASCWARVLISPTLACTASRVSLSIRSSCVDSRPKRAVKPSASRTKAPRSTVEAGLDDSVRADAKNWSSALTRPMLSAPITSITRLAYSTMGIWLWSSELLLRRLDSANASYWRCTRSKITPVPMDALPSWRGAPDTKVTSWRE